MKKQNVISRKMLTVSLAVTMIFTTLGMGSVYADVQNDVEATPQSSPITVAVEGQILDAEEITLTEETVTNEYCGTAKVYVVKVPYSTEEVTVSGYNNGSNFLAYNYKPNGEYIAGSYEDATLGAAEATVKIDADTDGISDYIYIQTPYTKDNKSEFIAVIKFEKKPITTFEIKAGVELTNINILSSASRGKVYLSWVKSKGFKVDGYKIYRATKKDGTYKLIKTVKTSKYTDSSLKVGKRYFYKVRGYRKVDGNTVYTKYSRITYRTVR